MDKHDGIFVAGARGMVGSAIVRRLRQAGFDRLLTPARAELDLTDRRAVEDFFASHRPSHVFLAAAKVGGILANASQPGDFIRDNLLIQTHVIDASYRHGATRLQFLGSSCIYPKYAPQPMTEEALLTGPLEPTNQPYALAKIAGIEMVWSYRRQYGFHGICLMPTNLYGPGDSYDLQNSHVVPAMLMKFHEAKLSQSSQVSLWGTGTPRREFLHVDDLADAALFFMENYDDAPIVNIGAGQEITIHALASLIADIVGFRGDITFDSSKPDGAPRKLLDVTRAKSLGWHARIALREGLEAAYQAYLAGDVHRS